MEGNIAKLKKVLIISPHFPPVNAADMHRVRQSLPYFKQLGWEPVVVVVDKKYIESYSNDPLLLRSVPPDIRIIKVKAFSAKWTRKFGLGSLSMRSYWFYKKMGDRLLKEEKFDLVYFSTTAFHVMALGPGWKKKYNVPFITDIQDPWRRDYYLSVPKKQRPPKFWLTYHIDKTLEAKTIPFADGIISVSKGYCDTFLSRYPNINPAICKVIPFGGAANDFVVAAAFVKSPAQIILSSKKSNVVYIGRGGNDMKFAVECIFRAVELGLKISPDIFEKMHFWFIGTSYALAGTGRKTIEPLAKKFGLQERVTEITERLPYFETLWLLKKADILLVPGSDDVFYTASKIYPYILACRPLIAVFNENSSVVNIIKATGAGTVCTFSNEDGVEPVAKRVLKAFVDAGQRLPYTPLFNAEAFKPYTDQTMAEEQVKFFNQIIRDYNEEFI